jgi:hypothetical protein
MKKKKKKSQDLFEYMSNIKCYIFAQRNFLNSHSNIISLKIFSLFLSSTLIKILQYKLLIKRLWYELEVFLRFSWMISSSD